MDEREHEQLDIYEIEHRVAVALVALVDDPSGRKRITAKSLALRTKLPLRRVREVTDAWSLQTLSGDELWLGPGSVEMARARAESGSGAELRAAQEQALFVPGHD